MGLVEVLNLIKGVLKFPDAILALVKLLEKTPIEKHEALIRRMTNEAVSFEETGRPLW